MEIKPLIFKNKGFPTIKIFDNHFEIKAIDYWEFRVFNYSDIIEIIHYNPNKKWWNAMFIKRYWFAQIFSKEDPWILRVLKNNGGDWIYQTSYKPNSEFQKILSIIKININKSKK